MDAVKFLEEYSRMCNAHNDCVGCPMDNKPFCYPNDIITNDERKELVDAVEKWSCEHPVVTNDTSDTVSRAAAIDAIDRAVTKEAARWALQELPSAVVVRQKKGHWIHIEPEPTPDEMRGWMPWYCSECGAGVGKHQTAFCPNCGADMRGKE